jgi:hypothetical protein
VEDDDELWEYHTVTKIEAAQRQLDAAIELWFRDGDAVSIHTLVGAAYQILHDVNKKRGGPDVLVVDGMIPPEHREEFRKSMRRDFMFFKHADRSPDAVTIFPAVVTMLFFMVSIHTLGWLDQKLSVPQRTFTFWMALRMPSLVNTEMVAMAENAPAEYGELATSNKKRQFFEEVTRGFALADSQSGSS